MSDTKADTMVKVILDTIQRMGLKIENARGQCYDGALTMAGVKNGVAAKIKLLNSVHSLLQPCTEPSHERLY